MISPIFSCLSFFGLRDDVLNLFAFHPPKVTYVLRNLKYKGWKQDQDKHKNSLELSISRNTGSSPQALYYTNQTFEEPDVRLHIVGRRTISIEHPRNSYGQASFTQVKTQNQVFPSDKKQSFDQQQIEKNQKKERDRSISLMDQIQVPKYGPTQSVIPEESEESSYKVIYKSSTIEQHQTFYSRMPQNKQQYPNHEVLLISNINKEIYPIPYLENIKINSYYIKIDQHQFACFHIEYTAFLAKDVIIFSHGNSSDLGLCLDQLLDLVYNLKVNLFAYEYPGYGQASGECQDGMVIEFIKESYKFVREQLRYDWKQIILYGYSIGSGPTVTLVYIFKASLQDYPIKGMILHSPLASGLSLIEGPFKIKINRYDIFPNKELIKYIKCPVFLIHGKKDNIISFKCSVLLSQRIQNLYHFWLNYHLLMLNRQVDDAEQLRYDYFLRLRVFIEDLNQKLWKSRDIPLRSDEWDPYWKHIYQKYNRKIQNYDQLECSFYTSQSSQDQQLHTKH